MAASTTTRTRNPASAARIRYELLRAPAIALHEERPLQRRHLKEKEVGFPIQTPRDVVRVAPTIGLPESAGTERNSGGRPAAPVEPSVRAAAVVVSASRPATTAQAIEVMVRCVLPGRRRERIELLEDVLSPDATFLHSREGRVGRHEPCVGIRASSSHWTVDRR